MRPLAFQNKQPDFRKICFFSFFFFCGHFSLCVFRSGNTDKKTNEYVCLAGVTGLRIRINLSCWIRIRIQISDPDPGGQKLPKKIGKSAEFSCFAVLDVLFWWLKASLCSLGVLYEGLRISKDKDKDPHSATLLSRLTWMRGRWRAVPCSGGCPFSLRIFSSAFLHRQSS